MHKDVVNKLISLVPEIKRNIPLANLTSWNVGGIAEFFWEPDYHKMSDVFRFCFNNHIPVWYLGRGTNVLIDSNGLEGLVICTKKALQSFEVQDDIITAEAGYPLPKLSKKAAELGWGGYEYLIGIPGTIGAGITINAGLSAHGRKEIGDVLIDVELMDRRGNYWWENKDQLDLDYRSSNISERGLFVLKARFKATEKASKEEIKHKTALHLAERRRKQPLSKSTAGSTFKQPSGGKAAGWYIENAGLKGCEIGGAKISEKHANWIETSNADSEDIYKLILHIIYIVHKTFNILLEPEVVLLSNTKTDFL